MQNNLSFFEFWLKFYFIPLKRVSAISRHRKTATISPFWLIFRIIMVPYKDFWEKNYIKNEAVLDN